MLSKISQTEKTNVAWYHLYVESTGKKSVIETECRMVIIRGWNVQGVERCLSTDTSLKS